jgi:hypothetical protein
VSNLIASVDNLYAPRIGWQPFADGAWDAFDFDRGDWDDGLGYENVCDRNRPLCRTMSGIGYLTYSAEYYPKGGLTIRTSSRGNAAFRGTPLTSSTDAAETAPSLGRRGAVRQ